MNKVGGSGRHAAHPHGDDEVQGGTTVPRPPGYTRRRTSDRDEAEQVISELYLPSRLDLSRGSAPLAVEVAALQLGVLTAGRLSHGRRVRLRTSDARNFHVNTPLRGRAASRRGSGDPVVRGPGRGLIFSPGEPAEISWSSDCVQLCLMIPRAGLEAELERLLGRSIRAPLTFDFTTSPQASVGRQWPHIARLLAEEIDHPNDRRVHEVAAGHVEGLVMDTLLLRCSHNYSEAALGHRGQAPRAAIRAAVGLIEDRPTEPWSTVRLAGEVHLSARALQDGFSRDVGIPPMTYVREVRLRRTHEALRRAARESTTVQAVAREWGFVHMGRFARAYREAFGELPSETLARDLG
ncbi:AraC family transcriptional regulator [Nocardioides aquiterrae]|uniref:AraC family transcriptional regulator n=1 Tax=Nocardioides aquiterrae TaxID=203799 RepID=A0ABP4F2A5_9ACTN